MFIVRESKRGGGAERGKERENPEQAPPDMGLALRTMKSWSELKSIVGHSSD